MVLQMLHAPHRVTDCAQQLRWPTSLHFGNACGQPSIVQQGVDGCSHTTGVVALLVLSVTTHI